MKFSRRNQQLTLGRFIHDHGGTESTPQSLLDMEPPPLVSRECPRWPRIDKRRRILWLEEDQLGQGAIGCRKDVRRRSKKLWVSQSNTVCSLDSMLCLVHAWGYRRYVLASMPIPKPQTSELAYTTRKIEANFSNFSAWHQRSKVYCSLWDGRKLDPTQSREEGLIRVHSLLDAA